MKTKPNSTITFAEVNQRLAALCALLIIAAICAVMPSCVNKGGVFQLDQEKLTTAFLAAGEAALAAKTSGASSDVIKQSAIQSGLNAIKTQPSPVELPVTESK